MKNVFSVILGFMTRSRPNPFKVFEFDEADERVHTSSVNRLRKLGGSANKIKKQKHNKARKSKPSPVDKSMFFKFFTGSTQAWEKETCNELIDVYSEDGLDIVVPQKENNKEAIDLEAEVTCDTRTSQKEFLNEAIYINPVDLCGSRTLQDIICNEPTDHTTIDMGFRMANHIESRTLQDKIFKHNECSSDKDLTNGLPDTYACCQVGITLEDCATIDCACPDHFVSGSPVAGGNSFPATRSSYLVTTPCSRNNVSINTISDDDERTEVISSSYASSPEQNEALLRGVPEHGIGRHCHEFYPKGEQDAVSISQREIELLQPERFINDNIIDFYINHLKNKIVPDKRQRFHFFNCFFFRKLADLDKESFRACEGRAAFERVRKWTKEVNLFEKDYIFIPINFKFHWSLVVVCHPGEVVTSRDEEVEIHPKVPCILHMNSIKRSHRGLKNIFKSYLCELWKEKHGVTAENLSSRFLHLKLDELELPQQENWYDCGLFLLHYVELFLKEAPVNFNPLILKAKSSNFLSKNWFPPIEASRKRAEILEMIKGIFKNGSEEVSPADCSDRYSSIQLPNTTAIEIVEEICQSTERCHVSTPRSVKCTRGSGLFAKDFPGDKCSTAACQMNMMPLIEVNVFVKLYTPKIVDPAQKLPLLVYFHVDGTDITGSLELDEVCGSPEIEEIGSSQSQDPGETRRYDSFSTSRELETYVVEDSDSDDVQEGTGSPCEKEMSSLCSRGRQMNTIRQSSKRIVRK